MKKIIIGVVVALLIGGGVFLYRSQKNQDRYKTTRVITQSTTLEGNQEIPAGERTLVQSGSLNVKGDLTINGALECQGKPLIINVTGALTINGLVNCALSDQYLEQDDQTANESGITMVVSKQVTIDKNAVVISNGHVQVVDSESKIVRDPSTLNELFDETGRNDGTGTRVGPFVNENATQQVTLSSQNVGNGFSLIPVARAEQPVDKNGNWVPNITIGGTWYVGNGANPPSGLEIPKIPKSIKKVVVYFNFGQNGNVALKDFHLVGPSGRDGKSSIDESCNVRAENGENAFRFRVNAANIELDDFRLELGDGGSGGTAETKKDCDPIGVATGGDGGQAGNFKMTAEGSIDIKSIHIVPGVGGNGGNAVAYGKDGTDACPGKKGADATANAGRGGDNKKELSAIGSVLGVTNIVIDRVEGGWGGQATAKPGRGGNGTDCKCAGGKGGNAIANGGQGGEASLKLPSAGGTAIGGTGGNAEAVGNSGGAGGMCPNKPSGGNGGNGGNAAAKFGKGGKGSTQVGADGIIIDNAGGNGGNGGDGCGPGGGGSGGQGDPRGTDGKPGNKVCPEIGKKTGTSVQPGGTTSGVTKPTTGGGSSGGGVANPTGTTGTTGATGTANNVKVISYNGKYLPVDQLIVENEVGCGADHWHAAKGYVMATDGTPVLDPGPQCGYGKVKDKPTQEIAVSAR